jgi:glycosyltransferase involved in cell wall biosynthesis
MKVTVLTATLPPRAGMLAEAVASVAAQTHDDVQHLVGVDEMREGAGAVLNRLLPQAEGDWLMVLDDDDLLHPHHVATALRHVDEADVIYALPEVTGGEFTQYDLPFNARYLAKGINCISHTALMRTSLIRRVEGWRDVRAFDLDIFRRLEQIGAEFHQIPEATWTYRLHGSNWSHGTLAEAAL